MNLFGKNPFITTNIAKPIKPIKQFNEKEKIENIKETMSKLKKQPIYKEEQNKQKEFSVNEKINTLKDMDRLK